MALPSAVMTATETIVAGADKENCCDSNDDDIDTNHDLDEDV